MTCLHLDVGNPAVLVDVLSVKGADDLETLLEAVGLKLSPLQMEPLQKTEAEFTAEMRLPFLDVRSM